MLVRPNLSITPPAAALLTLILALMAAAPRAEAQHPDAPTTAHRAPRVDADSMERLVRRLKLRADSLAREYGDNDALSMGNRQRLGEELDRTVDALERALGAANEGMLRAGSAFRMQLAPMADARAREAMLRVLTQRGAERNATPRGSLGFVATGVALEPWTESGQLFVRYLTYPEIVSVEPSSPAQRAGIVPGDTLIAYDGRDVRDNEISMTRLLKPNARVLVRIARDGRRRDVPVIVADAPSRVLLRRDDMNGTQALAPLPGGIAMAPGFPRTTPRAPAPPPSSAMRRSMVGVTAPVAPLTPAAPTTGLAGAQMGSITRDWARLMGVPSGVLVMRVPAGSPAAESGLRDADVIVKAGGRAVRTLPDLAELVEAAWREGGHALAIEFVREGKSRSGQLRW